MEAAPAVNMNKQEEQKCSRGCFFTFTAIECVANTPRERLLFDMPEETVAKRPKPTPRKPREAPAAPPSFTLDSPEWKEALAEFEDAIQSPSGKLPAPRFNTRMDDAGTLRSKPIPGLHTLTCDAELLTARHLNDDATLLLLTMLAHGASHTTTSPASEMESYRGWSPNRGNRALKVLRAAGHAHKCYTIVGGAYYEFWKFSERPNGLGPEINLKTRWCVKRAGYATHGKDACKLELETVEGTDGTKHRRLFKFRPGLFRGIRPGTEGYASARLTQSRRAMRMQLKEAAGKSAKEGESGVAVTTATPSLDAVSDASSLNALHNSYPTDNSKLGRRLPVGSLFHHKGSSLPGLISFKKSRYVPLKDRRDGYVNQKKLGAFFGKTINDPDPVGGVFADFMDTTRKGLPNHAHELFLRNDRDGIESELHLRELMARGLEIKPEPVRKTKDSPGKPKLELEQARYGTLLPPRLKTYERSRLPAPDRSCNPTFDFTKRRGYRTPEPPPYAGPAGAPPLPCETRRAMNELRPEYDPTSRITGDPYRLRKGAEAENARLSALMARDRYAWDTDTRTLELYKTHKLTPLMVLFLTCHTPYEIVEWHSRLFMNLWDDIKCPPLPVLLELRAMHDLDSSDPECRRRYSELLDTICMLPVPDSGYRTPSPTRDIPGAQVDYRLDYMNYTSLAEYRDAMSSRLVGRAEERRYLRAVKRYGCDPDKWPKLDKSRLGVRRWWNRKRLTPEIIKRVEAMTLADVQAFRKQHPRANKPGTPFWNKPFREFLLNHERYLKDFRKMDMETRNRFLQAGRVPSGVIRDLAEYDAATAPTLEWEQQFINQTRETNKNK